MAGAYAVKEGDMTDSRPVAVIIGMPGAGKTRVGREVAKILGHPFLDSDERFEHEVGMKIPEYFTRFGEDEFRRNESSLICDLLEEFNGILALGGGAPMTPRTREALEQYKRDGGRIVYLKADPHEAMTRATRNKKRPMLAEDAKSAWKRLFSERDPLYDTLANLHMHTHASTPHQAAIKLSHMIDERIVHVPGDGMSPYDVHIGRNALEHLGTLLGSSVLRVALIHTHSVQRHADRARTLLRQRGYEVFDMPIPDAEAGKTVSVADSLWKRLATKGFTRSDAIVGLGGGATTDVAGFIAATWMRGITYVNCPTSMLAMVDASTGGKTGVNIPAGKNLVGAFYTPAGVLADLNTLTTLPNDVFIEGLGEVIKSGFIRDTSILDLVQEHADELNAFDGRELLGTSLEQVVAELIEHTVRVKEYYVAHDLRESGQREYLNYGHTLAHAIEQIEGFTWRHGNAVAVGCVYAAELANILGYLEPDVVDLHRSILASVGLPTSWDYDDWHTVLSLMHKDKKARGNTLRFVIIDRPGHPIHLDGPDEDALHEAFLRIQDKHGAHSEHNEHNEHSAQGHHSNRGFAPKPRRSGRRRRR